MIRRKPRKTAGKYRLHCNLGYNLSEEVVRRHFQQLCSQGQILDVYIPRHNSGRNKGYGFTTFESEADLLIALQIPEHVIEGNVVKINRAGPRPNYESNILDRGSGTPSDVSLVPQATGGQLLQQRQQWQLSAHGKGPRLYVGGIPDEISEEDVSSHFEKWGKVVDIYFPGKTGLRVNYCFVTFDNWQAAQRSCNQSERCIAGRPIQSISLAEERTVDIREPWPAYFLSQTSNASTSGLHGVKDWTQQFQGLNLHDDMASPDAQAFMHLPRLPDQGDFYSSPAGHPQVTGLLEDNLRDQLILQSVQPRNAAGLAPQQSQFWMPKSQRQLPPRLPSSYNQAMTDMSSPGSGVDPSLLQTNPSLGRMTYGELQTLQQAMTSTSAYPPAPEAPLPWQQERHQALLFPLKPPLDESSQSSNRNWQMLHPNRQTFPGSLPSVSLPRQQPTESARHLAGQHFLDGNSGVVSPFAQDVHRLEARPTLKLIASTALTSPQEVRSGISKQPGASTS